MRPFSFPEVPKELLRSGDKKKIKGHSSRVERAMFSILQFQYKAMSKLTTF